MLEEYDASKEAWKYYKQVYTKKQFPLISEFDVDNLCTWSERNGKPNKGILRYQAYIRRDSSLVCDLGTEFSISGDCAFNFKKEKIARFKRNVVGENLSERLEEKLKYCSQMHHTVNNLVLMPVTGGMNNLKGKVYFEEGNIVCSSKGWTGLEYDRLDTFLYILSEFYANGSKQILSESSIINRKYLQKFLGYFSDIYDYSKKLCLINDRGFVDRLIENGKKPIETNGDLENYIELAFEFWNTKIINKGMN